MALTVDISLSVTGDLLFEDSDISLVYDDSLAVQLFKLMFRSQYGDFGRFPHIGMNIKDFMQRQNTKENADELKERIYGAVEGNDFLTSYSMLVDIYPTDVDDLKMEMTLINPEEQPIDLSMGIDLVHGSTTGLAEYTLADHNIYINEIATRTEKIKLDEATNTFRLQFRPYYTGNDEYNIKIYNANEFVLDEEDQTVDEIVTVTSDEIAAGEFDFKNTDMYTNVLSQKTVVVLYMNDVEIDHIEVEDNNWVYEINDDLLEELGEDDEAVLSVYYTNATTTGVLSKANARLISPQAIAPSLEDNFTYDIRAKRTLSAGLYFVTYDSYLLNQ